VLLGGEFGPGWGDCGQRLGHKEEGYFKMKAARKNIRNASIETPTRREGGHLLPVAGKRRKKKSQKSVKRHWEHKQGAARAQAAERFPGLKIQTKVKNSIGCKRLEAQGDDQKG